MSQEKNVSNLSEGDIQSRIYFLRGRKVMLDSDLAELYKVPAKQLNRQVKRNIERFPEDFMFQLTPNEEDRLRCQFGTSNAGRGGRRYLPYMFTEQGVAMLSSILRSKKAIQVNIQIMRVFTKLRQMLEAHKDLREKIEAMEKKYDHQFKMVFDALRELLEPPRKPKRKIGFH